jgi:hypothetical protein
MFEVFTEAGTAAAAGVFLPLADLPGLTALELATTGSQLEGHLAYALLNALYSTMAPMNTLGVVNLSKSNPTGTGAGLFTEAIGFAFQRVVNLQTGSVGVVPLATIGTETGLGSVAIADIFPDAEIVAESGAVAGAGIVVPDSVVANYGAASKASIEDDARDWIGGLLAALAGGLTVRSTTVASALTSRTALASLRSTGVAIPPTWYDATNPITGIAAADLNWIRVIQDAITIEYELAIDSETQSLSLSVRTA